MIIIISGYIIFELFWSDLKIPLLIEKTFNWWSLIIQHLTCERRKGLVFESQWTHTALMPHTSNERIPQMFNVMTFCWFIKALHETINMKETRSLWKPVWSSRSLLARGRRKLFIVIGNWFRKIQWNDFRPILI